MRTCLYLAALAPSGMGKEEPREVNKRLAAEADLHAMRLMDSGLEASAALYVRAAEKVMKLALLGALAQAGGSLDRTTLLRKMGYSAQTLQKIILTLHMCDLIEEETIGRRKIVYTLKAA